MENPFGADGLLRKPTPGEIRRYLDTRSGEQIMRIVQSVPNRSDQFTLAMVLLAPSGSQNTAEEVEKKKAVVSHLRLPSRQCTDKT
jgi:hypothetical protein